MQDEDARDAQPQVPLLPLKNVVVFPRTIVNLTVGRARSVQALNMAMNADRRLVVIAQKSDERDEPRPEDLYEIGTLVEVRQVRRQPDASLQVEVESLSRVRITSVTQEEPCMAAHVEELPEKSQATGRKSKAEGADSIQNPGAPRATKIQNREADALMRHLAELFVHYASLNNKVPQDAPEHVRAARNPGYMADLLAAHLLSDVHERQRVLEMTDPVERIQYMGAELTNEIDVMETDQRVRNKVRASLDKNQREFYLREQLKAIHDELSGEGGNEIAELRERLEKKGLPDDILPRLLKEVGRLERMPSVSPESTVLRNYLDWVLSLPWSERSDDRIDLPLAEQVLEEDHYGLEQVKERILDFLAVRQLTTRMGASSANAGSKSEAGLSAQHSTNNPRKPTQRGNVLCFVGPPGVGKTSLGQSIARAMNRKFVRLSLGGVHDEAEIRGHRRTYVGAMPGRIVQGMKTAGTTNPVMLLDEIDKMTSDMRGDPAAAMLEVLDPEQNNTFTDHYLDVPYDLSDVLFITTANTLYNIPRPLRDRMEIIEIGGYTEEEKVQIARRHILPKQVSSHGLETGFLELPDRMLRSVIGTYTREAGVRELERKIAAICRKAARKVVQGRTTRVRVTPHNLEEFLGAPRYRSDQETRQDQVGVALGLAWTEHGGELLPVEVVVMPGRGSLIITGRLGDVMQESARAALSFARTRANQLQIDLDGLEKSDLHIHLPEGAIPKDGPSAGITMATALISALTRRSVRSDMAMTGEITLTGRVLAIGGLKEKVLAAHRAGSKFVIAPMSNKPDWNELPRTVRRELEYIWVDNMDQVVAWALRPADESVNPAVPVGKVDEEGEQPSVSEERPISDTAPLTEPTVQTASHTEQKPTTRNGSRPRKKRAASEG
jgi:ATP-dependent Lon protease